MNWLSWNNQIILTSPAKRPPPVLQEDSQNTLIQNTLKQKTTTTPTPSQSKSEPVVVVSSSKKEKSTEEQIAVDAISLKEQLNMRIAAYTPRRVRVGRELVEEEWPKEWDIPVHVFYTLVELYGMAYVCEQLTYMWKQQRAHDTGKSKNPVKNPSSYIALACKHNYANHKPVNDKYSGDIPTNKR